MKNSGQKTTEEICSYLGNLSRRRQVFRSLSMMQLKALITDAQNVLADRDQEEKRLEEQEAVKQAKIKQTLEQLKQDGVSANDLTPFLRKKKPSKGPVRCYLIEGEHIVYKGAGRMPAKLKALEERVGREGLKAYETEEQPSSDD
ncbi:TPA: H-NS histone family protein [Enterobacter roggenkampii]|nr:H-NS histone family protein [Enterobacter roggenkampii]